MEIRPQRFESWLSSLMRGRASRRLGMEEGVQYSGNSPVTPAARLVKVYGRNLMLYRNFTNVF